MPQRRLPWLRGLLAVLGLVATAALIWFVGPLVAVAGAMPLAGEPARLLALAGLLGLTLGYAAWRWATAARRHRALLAGLVAAATPDSAATPGAAEVAVLRQRFEQAVDTLRRSRLGGRGSGRGWRAALSGRPLVDQLPWYIIIGAPGAGKTTALVNAGLDFPLASTLGQPSVQGVGGTRNCDWWFTSEAVLIDTAGRYTTHDSDRPTDRAAWFGFLALLARYRPRRPINGVLLTLSASDLLTASPARRLAHAAELRERLEELHSRLGISFPVYVLVTKSDLLAGFMEFFADFDKDERAQVWGVTFPYQDDSTREGPQVRMASDFAALEKRLNDCLIDQLQGEADRQRRAAIYTFPQQWRVLRQALFEFLQALIGGLNPGLRPCIRGVYFTSATQEGTPIDRAIGGLVRSLGLPHRVLAPARPSGKSFFMTRLLRDVVFAEAGLAGTNLHWRRRRAVLAGGLAVLAAGAVAAAAVLSWRAYDDNVATIEQFSAGLPALELQVAGAKTSDPTDLPALLPVLDALAGLGRRSDGADANGQAPLLRTSFGPGLGLDRSAMLEAAAHDAYERALRETFLPRIAARLEARLRAGDRDHVELIYDALKAYLMLFGGRNFDRAALRAYLVADWELTLPASVGADRREALVRHLDRLLDSGEVGAPTNADPRLIASARGLVASVAPAERVYLRLKQANLGAAAAPFSVESAAGPAARRVFVRASRQPLGAGIAPLYSRVGFVQLLPQRTLDVLQQFAQEQSWVLGAAAPAVADGAAQQVLVGEVRRLVLADYARHWEAYLGDLRLVATPTLAASADLAQLLARPDSPLLALLRAAVREVSIEPLAPRFDALRHYVGAPSPALEELQALLGKLAAHLAAVDDATRRKALPPASDVARGLAAAAEQAPPPLRSMLSQLAATSAAQVGAALREPLARLVASEVGAPCSRAVAGQYPLARNGSRELTRDEFAGLFGAGGLFDGFFQRHLAAHVDTSAGLWSFRGLDRAGAAETLLPFQRARAIRDAYFRDGGRQFGMRLELRLIELDPSVGEFAIEVDGQTLRFRPGAPGVQTLLWPGPGADASGRVVLKLTPAGGGPGAPHAFQGPWALLRLLDRVRSEPGPAADRSMLVFDVEGRKARFEVKGPAASYPAARQELEQFQCPGRP